MQFARGRTRVHGTVRLVHFLHIPFGPLIEICTLRSLENTCQRTQRSAALGPVEMLKGVLQYLIRGAANGGPHASSKGHVDLSAWIVGRTLVVHDALATCLVKFFQMLRC